MEENNMKTDADVPRSGRKAPKQIKVPSECMVCGKTFARGIIDLQRHTTAVTLQHLFSDQKSTTHRFGCNKCNLFFTTPEHLEAHQTYTSCAKAEKKNKKQEESNSVDNIDEKSQNNVDEQEPQTIEKPIATIAKTPNAKVAIDATTTTTKTTMVTTASSAPSVTPSSSVRNSHLPTTTPSNQHQQHQREYVTEISTSASRHKRTKVIIPEERKAFFAVVSSLIPSDSVYSGIRLTEENYESYIPPDKQAIVNKLRGVLLYTSH